MPGPLIERVYDRLMHAARHSVLFLSAMSLAPHAARRRLGLAAG